MALALGPALTREEAVRALPAGLFQVVFVAGVTMLKSTAAALVVGRTSPSTLPALYIASALLTAAAAGLWPQGEVRAPGWEMGAWGALVLALAGTTALGSRLAVVGLYLAGDAFATLNQVHFWARAGELFDLRASRRLFAALSAMSMVGALGGGLVTQLLSPSLGPVALAAVSGLLAAACVPLGRWMDRSGPRHSRGSGRHSIPWGALRSEPLVVNIAGLVALLSVLTVSVDFVFRARTGQMMDERALSSLYGGINVWTGGLAAVFQLFLAPRFLDALGVVSFLGMVPAACLGLAGASLFTSQLWPLVCLKVVESSGSLSLSPLAIQLLYGPLPDDRRSSARTAIDGLVRKGGLGVGGLLLLAAGAHFESWLPLLVVAVAGAVLAVVARLKRVYVDEISRNLSRAHWNVEIALDAEGKRILQKGLQSESAKVVLTSLELLGQVSGALTPGELSPLLFSDDERVQTRAVELAGRMGMTDLLDMVRALLQTPRRRVREEALVAVGRLSPDSKGELAGFLDDADPGVRAAAISALWSHPAASPLARESLRRLAEPGSSPGDRRELAWVLGRLDAATALQILPRLMDDPVASVRNLAYESAARLSLVNFTPLLLQRVASRADRVGVRKALGILGDLALPEVEEALNDRQRPLAQRLEVPRIMREMGTSAAANALLHSNIQDAAPLRHRIGMALSAMRRANPRLALDIPWLKDAIGRRLEAYAYYAPIEADARTRLPGHSLLVRALDDRLDQSLEVAFQLLALLEDHDLVMDAHHRLLHGGPAERAFAAELVENVAPDPVRRRFTDAIDSYHRLAPPGDPARFEAGMRELEGSRDSVLRVVARATARRLGLEVASSGEEAMSEQVVENIFLLEQVELFGGTPVDDLAALAAIAHEKRVEAGKAIFRQGDAGDSFFVIVSGRVRIEREGIVFLRLEARDSFGEVSLLDGAPRPADVTAETDCHLLSIDRREFMDLVSDRPELLQGVLAQVARHLRRVLEGPGGAKVTLKQPVESPPGGKQTTAA